MDISAGNKVDNKNLQHFLHFKLERKNFFFAA
jgi:hypothetical protein